MNVLCILCIILCIGILSYLIGRKIGETNAMVQFIALIKIYDDSGKLLSQLEALLYKVDTMSDEDKAAFVKRHVEKHDGDV